jgi:hypothetical protein
MGFETLDIFNKQIGSMLLGLGNAVLDVNLEVS